MSDIFISYSRKDTPFVDRLVRDLESEGFHVFFDQRIALGEPWAATLENAIRESRYVLVVLSPDALSSEWIRAEIILGLKREAEGQSFVIPIMARACEPPLLLQAKTFADFRDYTSGLKNLLQALRGSKSQTLLTEDLPGGQSLNVDPAQVAQVRTELKQVAARFSASPERREAAAVVSKAGRKICFIVMPFGNEALQVVYEDFVRPVIETRCDLDCQRGDDVFGSSAIMDDIRNSIDAAEIVVADLTGKNPNVFYEVGICHTLDKPVLLMAQSMEDVPFDLRHRRVLLYEYSPRGCKKLEHILEQNVRAMLRI